MNNSSVIPFPQRNANNNRPESREKLTPQSLEAEQSTLGAMLMERDAVARAVEILTVDDFYRELHKKIFKSVLKLFDKGEPIDIVTIAEDLRRNGMLEEVGGSEYLSALIEACPSSVNVEAYAKVVSEKSVLRQLLRAADQISGMVYAEGDEVDSLVDQSEKLIFNINQTKLKTGFSPIKQLLMTAYDQIEKQFQHKGEATGVSTGFTELDDITSGLQPTDFIIVAARPSMGKCCDENVIIDDPVTGERLTIKEMIAQKREKVCNMSRRGELQIASVSDWIDSGVKPVWQVTTRLGRKVEVTGHHPFYTVQGWTPLHDIKVGEKIAIPRKLPVFGKNNSLSSERVRMMAYLIAEGGLTTPTINFTNADLVMVEDYKECVSKSFPAFQAKKCKDRIAYNIVYASPLIPGEHPRDWLKELGLWGKYAKEKYFPACVWTLPKPKLAEFLRVLFSCDGTIYKLGDYPRIEFTVASEKLAQDVQHALLRFGIVAKLWAKKAKYKGKEFKSWRVEITDPQSVMLYNAEIGWIGEKAGRALATDFWERPKPKRASNNGHPPREVWDLVKESCKRAGISLSEMARRAGEVVPAEGFNPHTKRGLPSHRLRAYAEVTQDIGLWRIASPDIYWDEIISIEYIGEHQVYDLTVPDGSNFVAQDIFVHNTALCLNIAHHIALKENLPVAIFSLEMSKEQLVQRLICSEASIKSQDLRRGRVQDGDWHRITNAVNRLYQAPMFIDDQPGQGTFEMRAKARRLMAEHGQLGLIVVDYLQLAHSSGKSENRVQEISEIARAFKSMARELKCPLIALSQLSRAVEQREDKRPMLSDLRESGCLTGETLVYLPDSGAYKRLDELEHLSGFRVLAVDDKSGKLEPRVVTRAFSTGVKPVYKLTMTSGRSIRATGNHKFLSVGAWKRLDEIAIGSHLALPRQMVGPRDVATSPMSCDELVGPRDVATSPMSHDELALLAHLIGDGSTLQKRGSYYTSGEEELARAVVGFASEVFGDAIHPKISLDSRDCWEVGLVSATNLAPGKPNVVAKWLRELGAWDKRSYQKIVPARVFAQSDEKIGLFLRHLWATDGCLHLKKCGDSLTPLAYYASNSQRLARDVQSLLLRLGVQSTLREVDQKGKGRPMWNVIVTGQSDMRRFIECVGAFGARRCAKLEELRALCANQIESTNRDVIPREVWRDLVVPAMQRNGLTARAMQARIGTRYCGSTLYKSNLSRERAARVAAVVECEKLRALSESDLYWDKVVSIEPDGEEEVYDLTVEGLHSFVANDIIVHNSIEAEADLVAFIYRASYYKRKALHKSSDEGKGGKKSYSSQSSAPVSDDDPEFDPDEGKAEIIIGKHRNGPVGTIKLGFQPEFARFTNLTQDDYGGGGY